MTTAAIPPHPLLGPIIQALETQVVRDDDYDRLERACRALEDLGWRRFEERLYAGCREYDEWLQVMVRVAGDPLPLCQACTDFVPSDAARKCSECGWVIGDTQGEYGSAVSNEFCSPVCQEQFMARNSGEVDI